MIQASVLVHGNDKGIDSLLDQRGVDCCTCEGARSSIVAQENCWVQAGPVLLFRRGLKTACSYRRRVRQRSHKGRTLMLAFDYVLHWYRWNLRCKLTPIVAHGQIVRYDWDGILRYIETRLTNGVVEGINSKIQLARTRARGYRSMRNFITMIYLVAGKLRFDLNT
jgi:hypothetical protein